MKKAFVIIPAYNEAAHIAQVLGHVRKYLPGNNIIVVDDGSRDSTSEIAAKKKVNVLRHEVNLGKGAALKTGSDFALMRGAAFLIYLDSDGQHDPAEIPAFLEALRHSPIVFGQRPRTKEMPGILRFGNSTISFVFRILYGMHIHDPLGGFRAMTAETYSRIRWRSSGYSVESEMIANVGRLKIKYAILPVKTIYRDRYKGTTVKDGIEIVLNLLWWRIWHPFNGRR